MTNFLVSSAGRRGALVQILKGIARDLGGGKVMAIDASPMSAAGHLADHFEIVPRINSGDFVDSVLEVASRNHIDVIIPTIDPEISLYAESRERFAQRRIDVWAPSLSTANLGFDKWALFNWLRANSIPTVETFEATDPTWKLIDGPVVAKPRSGSSSVGVICAASIDELPAGLSEDYIVQRMATGVELTVDFGVDRAGNFLGAVPRQRLEVRAGEVSKGVTVRVPEAERITELLAAELPGMYGVANVQMFFDEDSGTANVIEINPRFGGGYPLAHAAGADFVTALLEPAPVSTRPKLEWSSGMTMLRYDSAIFLSDTASELR